VDNRNKYGTALCSQGPYHAASLKEAVKVANSTEVAVLPLLHHHANLGIVNDSVGRRAAHKNAVSC